MFKPGCKASPPLPIEPRPRKKFCHIGAPACFALEAACRWVAEAFRDPADWGGIYIVGSVLQRPDWRDVDVRFIMSDDRFRHEFPDVACLETGTWEFDPRWTLLTVAISAQLSKMTGLPIDFQFQPQSYANAKHPGPRNAIGLMFASPRGKG